MFSNNFFLYNLAFYIALTIYINPIAFSRMHFHSLPWRKFQSPIFLYRNDLHGLITYSYWLGYLLDKALTSAVSICFTEWLQYQQNFNKFSSFHVGHRKCVDSLQFTTSSTKSNTSYSTICKRYFQLAWVGFASHAWTTSTKEITW